VPAISTGDIFRANVSEGTELGREAQAFMDAGEYVPDTVTNAMVRDRLAADDARGGFLLDGYPRTTAQVAELDRMLDADGSSLDAVVELTVDTDEVVKRLAQRATEQHRSDDGEAVQRHRLEVYAAQTAPLVDVYAGRGLLRPVDGLGEVAEVTRRILAALGRG
jgi:adenylate kinase